jgi:hypothetical protein
MKRGTAGERRWESGLRQGGRGSASCGSMASPGVQRSAGMRKLLPENRMKATAAPPLVATAALQAYLLSDADAKGRMPRLGPAARPIGKVAARSTAEPPETRRLSSASSVQVPSQERETPAEAHAPSDVDVDAAVSKGGGASSAESPLSRFQKHVRAVHFFGCSSSA